MPGKLLMSGYGALSTPGKMPGYSFSLPAGDACPASKLTIKQHGDMSTCAVCYAKEGNYRFPNVQNAQHARFDFVRASLKEDKGTRFVDLMVEEIRRVTKRSDDKMFRIHDSGDFFHPGYVAGWQQIATQLPDVRFWAPTREYLRPLMLPALRALAALPNVSVRPSAAVNDTPAPLVEGLSAGSAVYHRAADVPATHQICPATASDEHTCDAHGCRACWLATTTPIAYLAHGQRARRRLKVLDAVYETTAPVKPPARPSPRPRAAR